MNWDRKKEKKKDQRGKNESCWRCTVEGIEEEKRKNGRSKKEEKEREGREEKKKEKGRIVLWKP